MADNKYDESEGVWRTIGGRRVFIREGQSLSDAMISSGKFKKNQRETYRKAKEEDNKEDKKEDQQLNDKETNDKIGVYDNRGYNPNAKADPRYTDWALRKATDNKDKEFWEKQKAESSEQKPSYYIDRKKSTGETNNFNKEQQLSDKNINSLQHQARKIRNEIERGMFATNEERENMWNEFDKINDKLGKDRIDGKQLRNGNVFEFESENNNQMNDILRQKAYKKYLKEHPASKMSFEEFKKEK